MADDKNTFGLIIIGSGAAGLAAAVYAGRYLMKTLVLAGEFGGQTAWGGRIENYPGIKSIDGYDLMKAMKEQAESLGARVIDDKAVKVSKEGECFVVQTQSGKVFKSDTLIFATGAERRRLNLPNEKELTGKGVHYCVTCDAPLYSGKTIAIVGGGDASVKGANLAAEYVNKIYLITREKEIHAEPINFEQMKKLGEKVEIIAETEIKEIAGQEKFEKLILSKPYQGSAELKADGLFIEIGAVPSVELAKQLKVELDETGHIKTDNMMRTNVKGVYAAGDVVNLFGRFKQDITASAMGAVAATSAYEDFKKKSEICWTHAKAASASRAV